MNKPEQTATHTLHENRRAALNEMLSAALPQFLNCLAPPLWPANNVCILTTNAVERNGNSANANESYQRAYLRSTSSQASVAPSGELARRHGA